MKLITEEKIKELEKQEALKLSKKRSKIHYQIKNDPGSKWTICFLLCFFGGNFGWHRFYAGKVITGILYLFTLGFVFIGTIIDLYIILSGRFKNKNDEYFVRP